MAGDYPGIQKIYDKDGFAGLWRYGKGYGLKRWIKLRNWAKKRVKHAKDPKGFRKELELDRKKIEHLHKLHHQTKPDGKTIVLFDGKPGAVWIVHILQRARGTGIWHGTMISGVRTPAECVALCEAMCHQPSCPGTCAGVSSRHCCTVCGPWFGAADVTDPFGLAAALRSLGITDLIGDGRVLPADINHFSHYGN